ncbi:MAG: hypothetical protein LBU88_11075 [Treponema sp.]|jgi:hypothetical protein|nr:hypothetical protein [Treponema sp.]
MKKNRLTGLVFAAILLISGLVMPGCSVEFWDGFVDGYNSARYSHDSGSIFDKEVLVTP